MTCFDEVIGVGGRVGGTNVDGGTDRACLEDHTVRPGDTLGGRRTARASLYCPGGQLGKGDSLDCDAGVHHQKSFV